MPLVIRKVWVDQASFEDLEALEILKFDFYCRAIMQLCEAEYLLFEKGIHAKDIYNNRITNVKRWMEPCLERLMGTGATCMHVFRRLSANHLR